MRLFIAIINNIISLENSFQMRISYETGFHEVCVT